MIIIYLFAYIRIIEFRLSTALILAPPCAWHGMKAKKLTENFDAWNSVKNDYQYQR